MPVSASTPRIATNPRGLSASSKAATTPMTPMGATLSTRNMLLNLCSWTISTVTMMTSINRQDGGDRGLRLAALLDASANADVVSARQAGVHRRDLRRELLHDRRGLRARREVGLHCHGGQSVPTPDDGIFLAVLDGGDLAQRNGFPVRQRHMKRPDCRQRHALRGGGPDQDVIEPDPAAHLGGRDAGHDRVHSQSHFL